MEAILLRVPEGQRPEFAVLDGRRRTVEPGSPAHRESVLVDGGLVEATFRRAGPHEVMVVGGESHAVFVFSGSHGAGVG